MKACLGVAVGLTLFVIATPAPAEPYSPPADPALEARIRAEIAGRDPEGAAIFAQATAARDRGDAAATRTLLEQVHARDPWFVHATRRLCSAESALGNHEHAVALCREAYAQDPSSLDSSALAMALLAADKGTGNNGTEALRLAREAVQKAPDDYFARITLCQAALHMHDMHTFSGAVAALRRIAPDDAMTLFFAALDDGNDGRLDDADRDLEAARAHGLPAEMYDNLHDAIDKSRSPLDRWGPLAWKTLVGWLAVFGLLLALGAVLSSATLRVAGRVPAEPTGHAHGTDALLRRVYRVVLAATCAYYYLSLPLVALSVLGFGAAIVYFFLAIGQIPIKLLLIGAIVVFVSLSAMVRSLFVLGKDVPPGDPLAMDEHPRLRALLGEVAERIGTRPVDAVYVTPGVEIAVFERGGLLAQLRGKSERCLLLGAGVLDGMSVRELKAILAHEYGHFQNADTAGGGFALAVRRSLFTFALHMARGGGATVFNPAWWFVRAFDKVFHRVSRGATRLQEILADRWAAFAYGSEAFARGLRHVVVRSARFDAHVNATLGEVVPAKLPLVNVYSYVTKNPVDTAAIDRAPEEAMTRAPSPYDSHPRPADRIAWVTQIAAKGAPETEDDVRDAWSLFAEREALETRMTDEVRARLAQRGVRVQGVAKKSSASA